MEWQCNLSRTKAHIMDRMNIVSIKTRFSSWKGSLISFRERQRKSPSTILSWINLERQLENNTMHHILTNSNESSCFELDAKLFYVHRVVRSLTYMQKVWLRRNLTFSYIYTLVMRFLGFFSLSRKKELRLSEYHLFENHVQPSQ